MIPECVLGFWNEKDVKEYIFKVMENNLFLSNLEFKNEGIIHLLIAMWKIRCKMRSVQNEEKEMKLVIFLIQEDDGTIRNATASEEFVMRKRLK